MLRILHLEPDRPRNVRGISHTRTKTATEMIFAKEIGIVPVVFANIVVENNINGLYYFGWDMD
jgi:hypothetical protein